MRPRTAGLCIEPSSRGRFHILADSQVSKIDGINLWRSIVPLFEAYNTALSKLAAFDSILSKCGIQNMNIESDEHFAAYDRERLISAHKSDRKFSRYLYGGPQAVQFYRRPTSQHGHLSCRQLTRRISENSGLMKNRVHRLKEPLPFKDIAAMLQPSFQAPYKHIVLE